MLGHLALYFAQYKHPSLAGSAASDRLNFTDVFKLRLVLGGVLASSVRTITKSSETRLYRRGVGGTVRQPEEGT